jgi:predicted ABC-type sugar transport system permease subunit
VVGDRASPLHQPPGGGMKATKLLAAAIGVSCGLELVAAVAVGGAGLGAVFGWNSLVISVAALTLAITFITHRRTAAPPHRRSEESAS